MDTMDNLLKVKNDNGIYSCNQLVEASRIKLMKDLIAEFERRHRISAFGGKDEQYKWKLLEDTSGKDSLEIARSLRRVNVVDNARVDGVLKELLLTSPDKLARCINALFDEDTSIDDRIASYKSGMKAICPSDWNNCANDERTAASLLTCKYPEKYTFYKDEVYQVICQYFGYESRQVGKKYSHFIKLIDDFTRDYGDEIQNIMSDEISTFAIRPANLAVQTLFWCMKDYMKKITQQNMRFTWIPYYKEFADKLLQFRSDRKPLLEMIYSHRDEMNAGYLHDEGGVDDKLSDIDPFTVFGMFNRGIKDDRRIHTCELFKERLGIKAAVPQDFIGIPILNNQKSHFFGFRSRRADSDIENLWNLFECVVNNKNCREAFDLVQSQFIININLTMGLFWMRPDDFLAFDKNNRQYLKDVYGITIPSKLPEYDEYASMLKEIKGNMESGKIKEKSYCELSANAWSETDDTADEVYMYDQWVETWRRRKNIVLYGAPGTGKTFDVPELVVRLCDPDFDVSGADRDELMEHYNKLKHDRRVAFTTFHQSMDYEDWVEGLKPVIEDEKVTYKVEDGIFKLLCDEAEKPLVRDKKIGISPDAVIWKVSLAGTGANPVRSECLKNDHIRIGWDDYGPDITEETDWSLMNGEGKNILDAFINKMKVGDIVMSCFTNRTVDAIGVVTGEYEWHDEYSDYKRSRSVRWLVKNINEDIVAMNDGKTMTLGTVYRLNSISLDNVRSLLDKYKESKTFEANNLPYVMVIDELNRGNVSKVFGELITLLEPDKRSGRTNAESVILPYSKRPFSIPDNVFIIATMNTADRSLGSLDYAIRRRFAFIAERPLILEEDGFDSELFRKVSELFIDNYDEYEEDCYNFRLPLIKAETLSEEYKPEDVWIGHSYFRMNDEDGNDCTADRLEYEIIPLLEEYVRDGVLTEAAEKTIDELRQKVTE